MRDFRVNDVLKSVDEEHLWRILWIAEDRKGAYMFNMNTLEMPIFAEYSAIRKQVDDEILVFQDADPYILAVSEDCLSEKDKNFRNNIWAIMQSVVADEPNIYARKSRLEILNVKSKEHGKSVKILYKYLKWYWKRGKTKNAFLPNHQNCGGSGKEHKIRGNGKIGRPRKYGESIGINVDDEIKAIFERAVKKYYHTRNEYTLKAVYEFMIRDYCEKFISQDGLISEDKIPTIDQFRYWYNKNHDVTEKISKRKGEKKYALDHRAVLGKSDYGVMKPGAKYQIDATIGDIYLVSRFNRAEIIGRPVIYFVIDVFSRMVVGMYVGLEGPSWAGAMMALANAASDKVKYCAEYGVEITEDEWPCRHMPDAILADRGEMISKSVETLVNSLNVRVENAPAYRADMKGIVERYFRTVNDTAVVFLPGHVKPDMCERGGKDYRLDAKLDIHQVIKIIIRCVLHYNNNHYLGGYERTADMIADEVFPIPLNLWNWGNENYSGALRSFPEETVKLCLMPSDTATVTSKGIRFKGMYYMCEKAKVERWFETARAKGSFKVDVSYDPRNMSSIYVREGRTFEICFLAEWQDKYIGMCLDEIIYLQESEKLAQHKNAPKELTKKVELLTEIDKAIAEAEEMARQTAIPKSKTARTANIRENRRDEKERNRYEESFSIVHRDLVKATAGTPEEEAISPTLLMIKEQVEERLNEQRNN